MIATWNQFLCGMGHRYRKWLTEVHGFFKLLTTKVPICFGKSAGISVRMAVVNMADPHPSTVRSRKATRMKSQVTGMKVTKLIV